MALWEDLWSRWFHRCQGTERTCSYAHAGVRISLRANPSVAKIATVRRQAPGDKGHAPGAASERHVQEGSRMPDQEGGQVQQAEDGDSPVDALADKQAVSGDGRCCVQRQLSMCGASFWPSGSGNLVELFICSGLICAHLLGSRASPLPDVATTGGDVGGKPGAGQPGSRPLAQEPGAEGAAAGLAEAAAMAAEHARKAERRR